MRRLWVIAIAFAVIAGAAVAVASGLLDFREAGPNETTFPSEITCRQGTNLCTPGQSADGRSFELFQVVESAKNAQAVGAGVDTGDGKQETPLICTRSARDIRCGTQPPGGEKQFGLYLPG
jgi:hypothetical protein